MLQIEWGNILLKIAATPVDAQVAPDRKAQKRSEAQSRQRAYVRRKPLATRRAKVEHDLAALAAERSALDAWLAAPAAYTEANKDELKARLARQGDLAWDLARQEALWLELTDALEKLDSPAA